MGKANGWRSVLDVHPAAALFPMLDSDELRELGEDIAENGYPNVPISLYRRFGDDGPWLLLDGRNRLDAMEFAGLETVRDGKLSPLLPRTFVESDDPWQYVVSANIRRRHLTAKEKRKLIADILRMRPKASDRQVARTVGVSPTTVGKERARLELVGDVSKVDTSVDTKGREQPRQRKSTARAAGESGYDSSGPATAVPPVDNSAGGEQFTTVYDALCSGLSRRRVDVRLALWAQGVSRPLPVGDFAEFFGCVNLDLLADTLGYIKKARSELAKIQRDIERLLPVADDEAEDAEWEEAGGGKVVVLTPGGQR